MEDFHIFSKKKKVAFPSKYSVSCIYKFRLPLSYSGENAFLPVPRKNNFAFFLYSSIPNLAQVLIGHFSGSSGTYISHFYSVFSFLFTFLIHLCLLIPAKHVWVCLQWTSWLYIRLKVAFDLRFTTHLSYVWNPMVRSVPKIYSCLFQEQHWMYWKLHIKLDSPAAVFRL